MRICYIKAHTLGLYSGVMLWPLEFLAKLLNFGQASPDHDSTVVRNPVVTDITVRFSASHQTCQLEPRVWHRLEKDLYLHEDRRVAYLYVALASEGALAAHDLVVADIFVGAQPPDSPPDSLWEHRSAGLWIRREKFSKEIDKVVTEVDVLFGTDAVDPRLQWSLMQSPLQLHAPETIPVARLSVLHGREELKREDQPPLRVTADGTFTIAVFADAHMGTDPGVCRDPIGANGRYLAACEADPNTLKLWREVIHTQKPDFIVFLGDQIHHDVSDSQTVIFKIVSLAIEFSIPYVVVYGNHDSEGLYALSRTAQMKIYEKLPFSRCEPGPEHVAGVGNFYLPILAPAPSTLPVAKLYFLDSHGALPGELSGYDHIKQSQIDWFLNVSQSQRDKHREERDLSIAFFHIPLNEFADDRLKIYSGSRREPTEGPRDNSHFYDALVQERISAVCCGHDHGNDFCALLQQTSEHGVSIPGPWLCHAGVSGYRAYGSYDEKRFYRCARMFRINAEDQTLSTWKCVEYSSKRVDKMFLAKGGLV